MAQHSTTQPGAAQAQTVGASSYPDLRTPQISVISLIAMGKSWLVSPSTIHLPWPEWSKPSVFPRMSQRHGGVYCIETRKER